MYTPFANSITRVAIPPTPVFSDQLTLFKSGGGGGDYPHHITTDQPQGFGPSTTSVLLHTITIGDNLTLDVSFPCHMYTKNESTHFSVKKPYD